MIVKRPLCVLSFVFFSKIAIPRYNKLFAKFQFCLEIFCQLHTEYPYRGHEFTSGFSGIRVALSLVFCVMFYRSSLVLLFSFFWPLCCLSPSSFYGFWLTIWYPKTFINPAKCYWSASPTPWKWEVMYLWVRGIDFAPFCWILELVRQCGIFHFSFYYCWCCIC
jgi:hypothetical protein